MILTPCTAVCTCQVVAILAAGQALPFSVEAAKLDLPELQGDPEDISKEKCRLAAKQVLGAVNVCYLCSIKALVVCGLVCERVEGRGERRNIIKPLLLQALLDCALTFVHVSH